MGITRAYEYILDRYGNRVQFKDKELRAHVDELNATAANAVETANGAVETANAARDYVQGVETRCETAADNADQSAQAAAGSAAAAKDSEDAAAESARQAAESAEQAAGSAEEAEGFKDAAADSAKAADISDKSARNHELNSETFYNQIRELVGQLHRYEEIELTKVDTDGTVVVAKVLGRIYQKTPATVGISDAGDAYIKGDKISYTNVATTDEDYPVGGEEKEQVVVTYHQDGVQRVLDMSWQDISDAFPNVVIADGDTQHQITEVYEDGFYFVMTDTFSVYSCSNAAEYPRQIVEN